MLILQRRHKESIMIGDDIKLTVFLHGDKVRLGFDAPPDVRILRSELLTRDQLEATQESISPLA